MSKTQIKVRSLCLFGALVLSALMLSAQGVRWSYATRIVQTFDSAPEERVRSAPMPKSVRYPDYPWEMVRAGMAGKVTAAFTVVESGEVVEVDVVSSTQQEFADSVAAAVSSWQFVPLEKMGTSYPKRVRVIASFEFQLHDE